MQIKDIELTTKDEEEEIAEQIKKLTEETNIIEQYIERQNTKGTIESIVNNPSIETLSSEDINLNSNKAFNYYFKQYNKTKDRANVKKECYF